MNYTTVMTLFLAIFIRGCSYQHPKMTAFANPSQIVKTLELSENLQLEYVEQGNRSGTPVILLHGLTDSWHSFEKVLPLLSPDLHVFAISQRGHGGSTKDGLTFDPDELARDIADFILTKKLNQAVIVGHSMGSTVTQSFAIHYPKLCKGIVMVGAFASYGDKQMIQELMTEVEQLEDPIDSRFAVGFQESTLYNKVPDTFFKTVVSESMKVPSHVWRGALRGLMASDYRSRFQTIQAPTLILWGDQDIFCPIEDQLLLKNTIHDAELVAYRKTGHGLHWEHPKRFARDLEDFIQSLEFREEKPVGIRP